LSNAGLGSYRGQLQAYARIYQSLQAQAASLAYIDTFKVLAVGAVIMFLLAFVLQKNDPGGGGHAIESSSMTNTVALSVVVIGVPGYERIASSTTCSPLH
jgi:hypothetical protein